MLRDILANETSPLGKVFARIVDGLERSCRSYLAGTVMLDEFGSNHNARRQWRAVMAKAHGSAFRERYDRNKLRLNNIGAVCSNLQGIVHILDEFDAHNAPADELRKIAEGLPDLSDYNEKTNSDKIRIAEMMDSIATTVLNVLKEDGTSTGDG